MNSPVVKHAYPPQPPLQDRAVRDLAWALCAPPLFTQIDDWPPGWLARDYIDTRTDSELWPWLYQLDSEPNALHDYLARQHSTRLGIYFEYLISFYLQHHPRFDLLAQNYQVNGPQRTLGEFDFIVYDRQQERALHIESAVKFYLGHRDYRGTIANNTPLHNWHQWIGPNQKDSLAIKMRHLKERQLLLSDSPEGRQALKEIGVSHRDLSRRLLISGRCYFPRTEPIPAPHGFNSNNRECHYWSDSEAFLTAELRDTLRYCCLPRRYWLSPILAQDSRQLDSDRAKEIKARIQEGLQQNTNEWQIAALEPSGDGWIERERFFVINRAHLPAN